VRARTPLLLITHTSHPRTRILPTGDFSLLLAGLVDERLVDVRDDAAARDGGLDQGVQLLVTADGELQVAGRDALDLQRGRGKG